MKKLCGNCNVCCITYRIDKKHLSWRDIDKEAGETCDKLINKRCARYKNRPKPCKKYECLWLQILKLNMNDLCPVKWRPDNFGIIVNTKQNEENIFHYNVEELEEGKLDLNNSEILSFMDMIFTFKKKRKGTSRVIIYHFGKDKGHQIKQD